MIFLRKIEKNSILRKGHLNKTREQVDKTKKNTVFTVYFFMKMKIGYLYFLFCYLKAKYSDVNMCVATAEEA